MRLSLKLGKKILTLALSVLLTASVFTVSSSALSSIGKIQGKDKYETSALIADKQSYTTAILINGDKLADGLSASGIAGVKEAPILLTRQNSIPASVQNRLNKAKEIYIVGGTASVSSSIESSLKSKGKSVIRIDGTDRVETSLLTYFECDMDTYSNDIFFVAPYKGEADAVSIASAAYKAGTPVVLADDFVAELFESYWEYYDLYAIGGKNTLPDRIVDRLGAERIAGADRYETNKKVIQTFYDNPKELHISDGYNLVYPLIGSSISKYEPTVLVGNNSDKTVLKGAEKITAIGEINSNVLTQCLNAANLQGDGYITIAAAERAALENCSRRANVRINDLVIDYSELDVLTWDVPIYRVRIDSRYDAGTYGHFFVDARTGAVYKDVNEGTIW
ncbi:cell wall-binding repeat-containing protein [Metaclostridioides mangenotii]|uniref:cell wall-binding repeat-containing protein n=1 Tax=Metaclostridioides mangenotii TaxID=1540 RepID=UPI0026EAAE7E|nr:cell wall-binding repeat-containing protein [Clostridioides mangenotii]